LYSICKLQGSFLRVCLGHLNSYIRRYI